MNPPNEQVDHSKRSREWLEQAEARRIDNETEAMTDLFFAEAHASLAIAEQLERLNDQLAEVIDPAAGTFPAVIRVRTEGTEG